MDIFNTNISYTISNGQNTSLWNEPWLSNKCLQSFLIGSLPLEDLTKIISSIITYSNGNFHWNLDSIPFPIPPYTSFIIKNITLPLNPSNSPDSCYWTLTGNGLFNLKSAYTYINRLNQNINNFNLSWI